VNQTFRGVLMMGALWFVPCVVGPRVVCSTVPDTASLPSTDRAELDTTNRRETARYSQGFAVPGSDSTSPSGFFGTIKEGPTCKAQQPMWTIGRLGFRAFPLPYYQEEFGWDLGAIALLTLDGSRGAPPAISLGGMLSYSEREDRTSGAVAASLELWRRTGRETALSTLFFSRVGRHGGGLQLSLGLSEPEEGEWLTASVGVLRDEYLGMRVLGPHEWSYGDRAWGYIVVNLCNQSRKLPLPANLRVVLRGALSVRSFGGDFSYRLIAADLRWPHRHWEVWSQWGNASGQLPIQELFDLAVDARLGGIPIRRYRTAGFQSVGAEGRTHLRWGVFAHPYTTIARGDGQSQTFTELGLGFTIGEAPNDYDPDDWFLRVDIPAYSSHGNGEGLREKWDFRRFMFRVNLPIPSPGRHEEIRYRYPGR